MSLRHPTLFNHPDRFVPGWYWAIASRQLPRGQTRPVTLQGRDLVLYRGQDGVAVALAAYCPHMGAHLAEGRVDGNGLRCLFHNWLFDATGQCVDSPALERPAPVCVPQFPTAEAYGLVWVWTGAEATTPVPFAPELAGVDCAASLGHRFVKPCHPNVVMINAIDAHHFNTVHQLPLAIVFQPEVLSPATIAFHNTTRGGEESWFIRLIRPWYREAVTYSLCYWFGSTGTVTVGPDGLHFYIMFALRMLANGQTEGQTILLTPRYAGCLGWLRHRVLLWLTAQVGHYFAKGDTQIFQTIRFNFQTPTIADTAILQFVQHVEQQPAIAWGTWAAIPAESAPESASPRSRVVGPTAPADLPA